MAHLGSEGMPGECVGGVLSVRGFDGLLLKGLGDTCLFEKGWR